jgi:hypothetical protein
MKKYSIKLSTSPLTPLQERRGEKTSGIASGDSAWIFVDEIIIN